MTTAASSSAPTSSSALLSTPTTRSSTSSSRPLVSATPFLTAAVAVHLPPFWAADPLVWFAQVEAQFSLANVVSEKTKYGHVVSKLPPEIASDVRELLLNPPTTNAYTQLKDLLLERVTASAQKRLRQLLTAEELGDRKPTQLLRAMQRLMGDRPIDETLLKELFLQRLPSNIQMVLAASPPGPLDSLAKLADKVMESTPGTGMFVNATTTDKPTSEYLLQQISELTAAVNALQTSHRETRHSRSHSRSGYHANSRSKSRSRQYEDAKSELCYYHWRFGDKATKCKPGCSRYNQQGNDNASRN